MIHEPTDPSASQLTPEQMYETFNARQQHFADELTDAVYAPTKDEYHDAAHHAYWNYAARTSVPSFIEFEDQTPVIEYVADTIDEKFLDAVEGREMPPEEAMSLCRQAYDRYHRLARYQGHDLSDEQLERVFFPMRDLFRQGVRIANELGDHDAAAKWQKDWQQYSNGPEQEMHRWDPEVRERQDIYDRFLMDPDDREVWDFVEHMLGHEIQRGEVYRFALNDIPAEDLLNMAGVIRDLPKEEQYARLNGLMSNGERWSDKLTGLGNAPLARTIKNFQNHLIQGDLNPENDKASRHPEAVILGAGDTKFLHALAWNGEIRSGGGVYRGNPIAEHITVVEPNPRFSEIAENQVHGSHVEYVEGSPADLPFDDKPLDFIIGNRTAETMNQREVADFYMEVSRVLKRGGMYVDGTRPKIADPQAFTRWKGLLAQMVVDVVERPSAVPDRMDPDKEAALLNGLGLRQIIVNHEGSQIRVLTKRGKLKDVGFHALRGGGVGRVLAFEPDEN